MSYKKGKNSYNKDYEEHNERYGEIKKLWKLGKQRECIEALAEFCSEYPKDKVALCDWCRYVLFYNSSTQEEKAAALSSAHSLMNNDKTRNASYVLLIDYYSSKDLDKAKSLYDKFCEFGSDFDKNILLAKLLKKDEFRDKAIVVLKKTKPTNAKERWTLLLEKLTTFYPQDIGTNADTYIKEVIDIRRLGLISSRKCDNVLLKIYYYSMNFDEFLKVAQGLLLEQMSPSNIFSLYNIYGQIGDYKSQAGVLDYINNTLINRGDLSDFHYKIIDLLNGNIEDTLNNIEDILYEDPSMYQSIIGVLAVQDRYKDIMTVLEIAKDLIYPDAHIFQMLANCYIKEKEYQKAYDLLVANYRTFAYNRRVTYSSIICFLSSKLGLEITEEMVGTSYVGGQIYNYSIDKVKDRIAAHKNSNNRKVPSFSSDVDVDEILNKASEAIMYQEPNKNGYIDEYQVSISGLSLNEDIVTVLTIGDSKNILDCYPYSKLYNPEEDEVLVDNRPSQVDKFNKKYAKFLK